MDDLRKMPCPKCGRKGLHYASHPSALGYKDRDHAGCRFCHATFKINKPKPDLNNGLGG